MIWHPADNKLPTIKWLQSLKVGDKIDVNQGTGSQNYQIGTIMQIPTEHNNNFQIKIDATNEVEEINMNDMSMDDDSSDDDYSYDYWGNRYRATTPRPHMFDDSSDSESFPDIDDKKVHKKETESKQVQSSHTKLVHKRLKPFY